MEVGEGVGESGAEVEEGGGGAAGDAGVAVGGSGADGFMKAEDAADAVDAVQRRDKLHLGGAGVHEAEVDGGGGEGFEETVCTGH
jgi:hypothetical protein